MIRNVLTDDLGVESDSENENAVTDSEDEDDAYQNSGTYLKFFSENIDFWWKISQPKNFLKNLENFWKKWLRGHF